MGGWDKFRTPNFEWNPEQVLLNNQRDRGETGENKFLRPDRELTFGYN